MKMATSQAVSRRERPRLILPVAALERLEPDADILRVQCATCKEFFFHDAGFILRETRKRGYFRPNDDCRKCRALQKSRKKKPISSTEAKLEVVAEPESKKATAPKAKAVPSSETKVVKPKKRAPAKKPSAAKPVYKDPAPFNSPFKDLLAPKK